MLKIPRAINTQLYTPAEVAISEAMHKVEELCPADERLTEAVILLEKAQNLVASFINEQISKSGLA